jgi:hypothetical protein
LLSLSAAVRQSRKPVRLVITHGVRQRAHGITPKLPLLYDLKGRFANRAMQRDGFAVNIAKPPGA